MDSQPTAASMYLRNIARRSAAAYAAIPKTRAILLSGSSAEGQSDFYSDLDMMIYYDELPSDAELDAARQQNNGSELLWKLGERKDDELIESYSVNGVECQFAHATIAVWEQQMTTVLEQLDVTSPLQKAFEGTLHGIPLYGESLIQRWQAQIARYPDALARAMVEHYLAFTPIWYLQARLGPRDAVIWRYQIFVESAQNILGVLAGLNRVYYTTFQFKRMRRFIEQLQIAPPNLAERLENIFRADGETAIAQLETLVGETVALVEQHLPQIDTSRVRRRLGQRQQPWEPKQEV